MESNLTVIIPVYNAARYIERCIESCIIQEALDAIIVIDDGSTDDSLSIVRSKINEDNRICLYQHSDGKNHGRSASRNLGIQKSKTTWITFLDADDYFLEKRFSAFIKVDKLAVDGFYQSVLSDYESEKYSDVVSRITEISSNVPPEILQNFLIENREQRLSIISLIIRKELCQDIQYFDESLRVGEDTDFIWRASGKGKLLKLHDDKPKIIRGVHALNTYQSSRETLKYQKKFYEKWLTLSKELKLSSKAKERIKDSCKFYQYRYALQEKGFWLSLPIKMKYFWSKMF